MAVTKIEKIVRGRIVARAARGKTTGKYHCHAFGSNVNAVMFSDLDGVATFLRSNPGSGVRMNPGFSKIVDDIFIDGVPR
jgi:hypothetical protein